MTKRLFAWLLVLALVLSLVPSVAAESDTLPGASQWHDHTTHEGWTEIKEGDPLPTAAGKYYLSADVELTAEWTVTKDIHLCLNGHSIKQTKAGTRVAILTEGKKNTLSVYDCVGTGTVSGGSSNTGAAFNVGRTTTLSWYGGKLTGNTSTGSGTIYLQKATSANPTGGVFNMYGGEVSGNKVKAGGAVYTAGGDAGFTGSQVNLYGGTIQNNEATGSGGAIYATGRGKIHVENVTITGNKAGTAGSAIYAEGADHGILVKNATITGNTGTHTSTTGYSAAIYTCGAGTHLTLSGKAVIDGNTTANANIPDVVMQSSYSDVLYVNELSAGSKVNFKTNKVTAAKASEVIAIAEGGSQKGIFQSEWITYMDSANTTKTLTYGKDGFYFVEGHYHGDQKFVEWTSGTGLPQSDVDGVGYYLTKDVSVNSFKAANICYVHDGATLHLCMNGKTVSNGTGGNGAPFEVASGNLYISDCTTLYDEDGYYVSGSKITGFKASGGGGVALYVYRTDSVAEVQGVEFTGNENTQSNVNYNGGAVQVRKETAVPVKLVGCKLANNTAAGGGGAVLLRDSGKLTAEKCIFTGNTAKQGGAIYTTKGTLVLKDCRIEKNHGNSASAISILDASHVTIADTVITGNTNSSTVGYGAINSGNSSCVVKLVGKTVIYDNLNKDNNQQNLHAPEFAGVVYDLSGLTAGAKVGVALRAERITAGYLYFSTTGMTAVPSGVVSDNEEYTIGVDDQGRLCYETKTVTPPEGAHSHKLCADAACADHTDMSFQKWEQTDSLPTSGNWYLAADVNVAAVTETTGDLTICLNGKTITQTAQDRIFLIAEDKALNITDCGTTGIITGGRNDYGAVARVNGGASFNLYAGKLTGNGPKTTTGSAAGAAVYLQMTSKSGATFNMYGGEITGNGGAKCWGGAVTNASGHATNTVYVNIYGGKIYGNTTGTGGAIRMENASVTTIYGGEIYDNEAATYGGAIYVTKNAQLRIEGGKIYDNEAGTAGGGVYVNTNAGKVTLAKAPTIDGNKSGNLYLAGETVFTAENLTGGKVGLSRDKARTAEAVSANTVTEAQMAIFSSDMDDYNCEQLDGKVALTYFTDHMHTICNDSVCTDHTQVIPFRKWEKTDSLPTSGNWYLADDVQLSKAFYDDGFAKTTEDLNLCLNGHTVTALEGKRVTMVTKDTTLNLTDCNAAAGALTGGSATWGACININAGGTMNMYGGKISGNECTANSGGIGAIYVQGAGATFNMYGGEISDNKSVIGTIYTPDVADGSEKAQINIYGGTICDNTTVSGKNSSGSTVGGYGAAIAANKNTLVTIAGGVIENNTGSRYGAIFITGQGTQLTMTGGEIRNNTATNGAAVMMQTRSVFNLQGGTISGNKTTGDGGAIYVSTNTDLNMTGGTITGNQSGDEGGAIYAYRSRANLLGGKITDNISKNSGAVAGTGDEFAVTVGGDVQIIDNTVGTKVVNVYLADGQLLKLSDVKAEAKIGVTAGTKSRVISEETTTDCSGSFQADHTKMQVVYKENALWLEKIPETSDHFHCVCTGIKNDACDHTNQMWIQWGDDEEEKDCLPTETGYYYLVSDITMTAQTKTEKDQEIFLCLNGKTVTQTTKEERHLVIAGGTEYAITDCNETAGGLTGGYRTYGGSININTGAKLNLFAGKLYGNTSPDSEGGAIYLQENTSANPAIFNMYGGEITDNTAKSGGAIRAAGTSQADGDRSQVNIYGGLIARNHATGQGGAIYASNNTVVNLLGGTIDSNSADADGGALRMYTYAKLNLKGTDLTNNTSGVYGGAIFASYAEIVMEAGNISGNTAVAGGGIMMQTKSDMILNGGAISGNTAGTSGGAGIYVSSNTTFTMNDGVISGNKTEARGGGIYFLRAEATLNGGVIEKNESGNTGGGLNVSGTTLEINKITISGNSANEGGGLYINRTSTGSDDTLKYYPSTVTINDGALITGNKAPSNCGGMLIANEGVVVTMLGGEISKNTSKNGAGVMTWAGSTFILKGGKITNHKIAGNGGGMYISTNSTFKMEGGTITGNTAKNGGGAYFLRSDVTLSGGAITGNYAKKEVKWSNGKKTESGGSAGGFYATGAKVKLCGTSVTYNKAEGNGGGFVTARTNTTKNGVKTYYNPIITITGGTISYNEGYNAGGLLTQTGTTTYFYGGTVSNNKANRGGGGVYISSKTTLYMTGGRIVNNYATTSAGGIYFYKSTGQVTGGEIHDNTAKGDSGNVLVNGAEANVVLKNLKIYGGKAKTAGGMVYQSQNVYRENGKPVATAGGSLYVENCDFFDNQAEGGSAGGVYIGGRCNPTFVNCKFFDNECTSTGGGVRVEARSFGTFTNCEFTGNTSGKDGGGLWVTTGTELTMTNPVFRDNHAEMKGGAIGCFGNIDMTDAIIENNTAKEGGGAVYSHFNTVGVGGLQPGLIMRNTVIRNNSTEGVGGALWVHKSTRVKLYDSEITGNTSALEGGAIWAHEDLELHNTSVTGNTSGGEGYAVYMNDAEYDGHSYMASRNRITGNVVIKDNEGGNLWMGPDVVIVIGADGLGEKTHIELVMDSGVLTNRLFGAYHYEGGNQVYTVTYGDRSMTEPEYDASLVPEREQTPTDSKEQAKKTDTLLYVGIGVIAALILAVGIVLVLKKKKAAEPAKKD